MNAVCFAKACQVIKPRVYLKTKRTSMLEKGRVAAL